jgi:hypothetical protein
MSKSSMKVMFYVSLGVTGFVSGYVNPLLSFGIAIGIIYGSIGSSIWRMKDDLPDFVRQDLWEYLDE